MNNTKLKYYNYNLKIDYSQKNINKPKYLFICKN